MEAIKKERELRAKKLEEERNKKIKLRKARIEAIKKERELRAKKLEDERNKIKAALGHEPTQENWQDYYDLKKEKTNKQKANQREIDREKIRRLVFGEDSGSSETG